MTKIAKKEISKFINQFELVEASYVKINDSQYKMTINLMELKKVKEPQPNTTNELLMKILDRLDKLENHAQESDKKFDIIFDFMNKTIDFMNKTDAKFEKIANHLKINL